MTMIGYCTYFYPERGFGFLRDKDRKDYFCHHSAIEMEGFKQLEPGQECNFEIEPSGKAYPNAVQVIPGLIPGAAGRTVQKPDPIMDGWANDDEEESK